MTIDTVLDASGYHLETSADGKYVFGVGEGRTFSVIQTDVDTVVTSVEFDGVFGIRGLSETPDGKYILLAGSGGLIKIDALTYQRVDTVAVGYYRCVVSKSEENATITGRGKLTPEQNELFNNYPNPFNPATTIGYVLPVRADVKRTVFDVLGRTVDVLVKDVQEAGTHRLQWQPQNISAGVFFFTVAGRGFCTNA